MLPTWFIFLVVAVFGLIIGSFLNVVIYRFHTGRSLNDRSHCLSCGHALTWYELVPVFSYLVLRGRCRYCSSFIPYRYLLVESLTALAFMLAYLKAWNGVELILLATLLSVLIVGLVYDLYHLVIPDELSIATALLGVTILSYSAWRTEDWSLVGWGLLAGTIASFLYGSLWYFSQGRAFGLGDAKLAFGLGTLVGLGGLFSFIVWSFWLGALLGGILIWLSTKHLPGSRFLKLGRVKMKSEVPFAPFLIASWVLVYFFEADILSLIEKALFALL